MTSRSIALGACLLGGAFLGTSLMAQDSAGAAPTVRPGDPILDPSRIAVGVDSLTLLLVRDGGPRVLSTLVRTVARVEVDGGPALRIVQEYTVASGQSVDTSFVRLPSLEPVRYAAVVSGEIQRIEFGPDAIRGSVAPRDSAVWTVEVPLSGSVFNAVTDREIIAALPLAEGYGAEFPVYNPPRTLGSVRVRVVGFEWLETASGRIEAWRLEYQASTGPASVLWVERGSGRFLRRKVTLPDGGDWWMVPQRDVDAWRVLGVLPNRPEARHESDGR